MGRTPNDDRSDSMNPNNDAYWDSLDNHSNQLNPNNDAYQGTATAVRANLIGQSVPTQGNFVNAGALRRIPQHCEVMECSTGYNKQMPNQMAILQPRIGCEKGHAGCVGQASRK